MKTLYSLLALSLTLSAHAQITYELDIVDNQFNPSFLSIHVGDTVNLVWMDPNHTFTQVDPAVWDASGTTPIAGGYNFGPGTPNNVTQTKITPDADVWFVCQFHVEMGMRGMITVEGGATEVTATNAASPLVLAPDPVRDQLYVRGAEPGPLLVRIMDEAGRTRLSAELTTERSVRTEELASGMYIAEMARPNGTLLSRQRFVVQH